MKGKSDVICRRGSILILVLFVSTVLGLVGVSFAYRAGLKSRTVYHRAVSARLRAQARSAVAIAMANLEANTNGFDHLAERWAAEPVLSSGEWLPEWSEDSGIEGPGYWASYMVIDEERKLNLLYASGEALTSLGMSAEQIESLFDWMDSDKIARAGGAEDDYYLSLPSPYVAKNEPLDFLDELLLVRGFGLADYYGRFSWRGQRVVPAADEIGESAQNAYGWVDLLTVIGDGRININTAPKPVLETLPLSDGAAEQIVSFRTYDENSSGELEEHAFRSAEDIEQLQGLEPMDWQVLGRVAQFRSAHFRIFVQAVHAATGLTHSLEVLVRATVGRIEVLQWKSGPQVR